MDNVTEFELVNGGTVRLPEVFLGSHYRQWDSAVRRKPSDGNEPSILVNWRGLLSFGEVIVDGEPITDTTGDTVPMALISECVGIHNDYMAQVLNPKN